MYFAHACILFSLFEAFVFETSCILGGFLFFFVFGCLFFELLL